MLGEKHLGVFVPAVVIATLAGAAAVCILVSPDGLQMLGTVAAGMVGHRRAARLPTRPPWFVRHFPP